MIEIVFIFLFDGSGIFFLGGAILAISLFVSCSSKGFKKLALSGKAGQKTNN